MAVSHVKSNAVANWTGTVTLFNSQGSTTTTQASALVQLGLLDPAGLPVAGAEVARKALDPAAVPSNLLMKRTIADELL